MRALFWSELRRFRAPALAAGVFHGLVLAALAVEDELFLATSERLFAAALGYSLAGLVLGAYQWATYRRRDLWLFLLHRPLAPRRIFLAVGGAGATALAAAVLAPLAAATALAGFAPEGVDPRHGQLGPYAWGLALAWYLVGAFVVLTPWRGAFLAAVLALPVALPGPLGSWTFAVLGAALLWLGWLAATAVRPDLGSPPRGRWVRAAAALPVLYVLFLALSFAAHFLYSFGVAAAAEGWRSFARHSWNDYFPPGSYPHIGYLDGRQTLEHGLALGGPEALRMGEHLDAVKVLALVPPVPEPARRHQPLLLDRSAVLEDRATSRRWTFRHDRMAFLGLDLRSGGTVGWVDGGATSFAAVPWGAAVGENGEALFAGDRLYRFDLEARRAVPTATLPPGERFVAASAGTHPAFDVLWSDRAIYLYPAGRLVGEAAAVPFAVVPLPGRIDNVLGAALAPVGDDVLVTVVLGRRSERDFAEARQVVLEVGRDGRRQVLVDAPLSPGLPAWARHRGAIVSPALQTLDDLVRSTLYGRSERIGNLQDLRAQRWPAGVAAMAAGVALAAALLAWALGGRLGLTPSARRAWAIAGLLLGLPVPFAMFLLTSRPS